ncbi:MAG: hypothetical protein JST79_20960 [Acidobacteria bacterium]|nr:hypothetical protein [Acidobacteriota bacterium]
MRYALPCAALAALLCFSALAQNPAPAPTAPAAPDYSGMYSFLQEGEFVQVTVEEGGNVTGFISRYGELESDRGVFLDHFFKEGKLEADSLTFTTKTVHGVFYQFKGNFLRGEGKSPADEAYYLLKGTLTQSTTGADKKETTKTREVEFKSFPKDADTPDAAAPPNQH